MVCLATVGITATFVTESVEYTAILMLLVVVELVSWTMVHPGPKRMPLYCWSTTLVSDLCVCLQKMQVNICSSVSVKNELNQPPSCGPINPWALACCEAVHLLSPQLVCSSQRQKVWITYICYFPISTVTYRTVHVCTDFNNNKISKNQRITALY